MTRRSYLLRAFLYMAIAALPEIGTGIERHVNPWLTAIAATGASLIALRAFVDKSPSEVVHPSPAPALNTEETDSADTPNP